jgi:hypothetical protein
MFHAAQKINVAFPNVAKQELALSTRETDTRHGVRYHGGVGSCPESPTIAVRRKDKSQTDARAIRHCSAGSFI